MKAALRLLRVIFTTATELSEFQRQVTVPSVVKFTQAVLAFSENQTDTDMKVKSQDILRFDFQLP